MQLFTNNASSKLVAGISNVSLSLQISAGDGMKFPNPTGGDYFLATLSKVTSGIESSVEIVKVTARATDVFTIIRAQEGTSALVYAEGDFIQLRMTAATATSAEAHFNSVANPHSVTKAQVGLGSVDDTADTAKPVSTAQQTALNLKANLDSPTFTGTVSGITKTMVGLSSVDNTSDADKPVSATQQTALNLKADLASPTFTGTVAGITKAMVGLGSVDDTSDTAKPVSTAQATAIALKQDASAKDATGGYAGLTLFKLNLKNAANTFTNFFTNETTAARTWTLPDKDGTVAMTSDITGTNSGTNTGDETLASIKTKLGITTLSGSNTGDQDLSGKQNLLVSGTDIKTINGTSLLGAGDVTTGDVVGQASSIDSEIALFSSTGGKTIKRATTTGMLKATSGVLAAATAGTDFVAPGTATTFTATQTFMGIGETQYNLIGTDLSVSNGTIQYKTLTANTTFTESLADGQAVILMLNPGTFAATWPTTTWIGSAASTAPTLVASIYNCLVFFQMNGTLYGRYVGRV